MNLVVTNKEIIEQLELREGFNKVTGAQLEELLHNTTLVAPEQVHPLYEDRFVSVGLTIRTICTNEVLVWNKDTNEIFNTLEVSEDPRQLEGYFLLMANVQALMHQSMTISPECIAKSVLQPIGVLREENRITVVFHLIIQDNYVGEINFHNGIMKIDNLPIFKKIEAFNTFTNLTAWTKMILPTLKIVGGNNIEDSSNREQWV